MGSEMCIRDRFIVVLFDAQHENGFWVQVRKHIDDSKLEINPEQETMDLRIPWKNKVTVKTIDRFRELSLNRLKRDD